ncbi:MAG: hypothetical protein NC822_04620 [Candidatus Omnitrophica bacterium]|nr:hypothetical protein [Candidatus Omnitrophota bacterium]MCM8826611.1 hypothetical protein [Candidatus Omnitrophota bacterium]
MNKKSIAFILVLTIIGVLSVLEVAMISQSIAENRAAQRYAESLRAFWLAEAGINDALYRLRNNFDTTETDIGMVSLSHGCYQVENIDIVDSNTKRVIVSGFVSQGGIERRLIALVKKVIPPNFYDYAIYSAGGIDFNGNTYIVSNNEPYPHNKAVIYAGDYEVEHSQNIIGSVTNDDSISPLARFKFEELLAKSQVQGNVYAYVGNKLVNTKTGSSKFPTSFWYSRGDDGVDNDDDGNIDESDEWVPNIVYINGDLKLNGNIGTIGGFFVVVGDVINTPDITQDAIINGNGQIDGVIYTRGIFRINGGGGNLNINGGVWSGNQARLNGNTFVTYNKQYMKAIEELDIEPDPQITLWQDTQTFY